MKTYKSTLAFYPKMVTSLALLALGLLMFASGAVFFQTGTGSSFYVSVAAVVGIGAATVLFYRKSLSHLSITSEHLQIHTRKGLISINIKEISDIEVLKSRNFKMASSSYGLFGFTGSTRQGERVWVNDFSKPIRIETSQKQYIVSCDTPTDFVEELKKRM